jgi:hypothetical protein
MCLICTMAGEVPKKVSVAEVIDHFKDVPDDDRFPERLRFAAAFADHWPIAVLMLAAARLEALRRPAMGWRCSDSGSTLSRWASLVWSRDRSSRSSFCTYHAMRKQNCYKLFTHISFSIGRFPYSAHRFPRDTRYGSVDCHITL